MSMIKEKQTTLGTVYERYNNRNELIQEIGIVGFVKEYERKYYFIIHDLKGNLIDEANEYLNNIIGNEGYAKREQVFTVLKHFYSFIYLFHIEDYQQNFTLKNVKQLKQFLGGGKKAGVKLNLEFDSRRINGTVRNYLNIIRDYYKMMFRIENNPLFDKTTVKVESGGGKMGHANKRNVERYTHNPKVKREKLIVPKYIKKDQYKAIINLVEKEYTLREKVIINLMYRYGLRLGEVLGLAIEDVDKGNYGKPRIILRNRVSDKPYQHAKGLFTPTSVDDYNDSNYFQFKTGYNFVVIDEEMKESIDEYIDETRDPFLLSRSIKKKENLKEKSYADRVSTTPITNNENQYIFLNHQHYTPLSASGWNYVIRNIFNEVGIEIDRKVKENNLSHRFRHGFAMNKVAEGADINELADALRHSSNATCKVYYNPDEEDQVKLLKANDAKNKESYNFE